MSEKLERLALLLMALIIGLLAWQDYAGAQEEKPVPVPMMKRERDGLLAMCEHANWASRVTFDGVCAQWKKKLEEAEKEAAKAAEPETK